jgi:hypothetical protein
VKRHLWQDNGVRVEAAEYPNGTEPGGVVERCIHCDTERTRERGSKTLYLYRGGRATVGRGAVSADGWSGYTVVPQCVER